MDDHTLKKKFKMDFFVDSDEKIGFVPAFLLLLLLVLLLLVLLLLLLLLLWLLLLLLWLLQLLLNTC